MTLSRSNRNRGWRPDSLLTDVIMASVEQENNKLDLAESECDLENDSEGNSAVRRPMNAFLIFCKRHRSLVREKYPHMENRSITKILGEWWANLEANEKVTYTDLAKQYKEAFMKANPDFRWYKLPTPSSRTLVTRPSNQRPSKMETNPNSCVAMTSKCGISPGKLADETQLGGLNSLITQPSSASILSKPPKKRYLHNGTFLNCEPSSVSDPQTTSACSALLELASLCTANVDLSTPNDDKDNSCSSESSMTKSDEKLSDNSATTVSQQQLINCIIESTIGSPKHEGSRFNGSTTNHLFDNATKHEIEDVSNDNNNEDEDEGGESKEFDALAEKLHQHLKNKSTSEGAARRKSERKGKGNRYQAMISEGILQPPKDRRHTIPNLRRVNESEVQMKVNSSVVKRSSCGHQRKTKKLNFDEQIAALPRCNFEALVEKKKKTDELIEEDRNEVTSEDEKANYGSEKKMKVQCKEENDDESRTRYLSGEFDLEKQIAALPSLNIEVLNQRKRQQRYKNQSQAKNSIKNKTKGDVSPLSVGSSEEKQVVGSLNNHLVGSQKRKARKRSITHIDPTAQNKPNTSVVESTLIESMNWKL